MPLSNDELNRNVDYATASSMSCRIHTGLPGATGTANRVAEAQSMAAANWTDSATGSSSYGAALNFGIIDANAATTVTHYSLYRGAAYVGWKALAASVTVPAGAAFSINADTIEYEMTTPSA